ncbi:hypothetical protein [Promicromonospora soli]
MIRRTIVTMVSALALALTASAPAQAAPTPEPAPQARYDTKVTADAKPEPVAKTKTITVKGTLKHKRGGQWRLMPRKIVTIHFDPAGQDQARKVATVRTTSTGSYTRKFTATRSGTWIVKYAGNSLNQPTRATDAVCVYSAGRWQCPVSPTNPDLDCPDIGKTVWVGTKDYHGLDADNDGWGCDSYS